MMIMFATTFLPYLANNMQKKETYEVFNYKLPDLRVIYLDFPRHTRFLFVTLLDLRVFYFGFVDIRGFYFQGRETYSFSILVFLIYEVSIFNVTDLALHSFL